MIALIGTNDAILRGSSAQSLWRGSVGAIINQLKSKTDRIAFCCLPPCTVAASENRALLNVDILSGYFGDLLPPIRFDLALSVNNEGATWAAGVNVGDNIHPNVAGNATMLERVRMDCPEAFD